MTMSTYIEDRLLEHDQDIARDDMLKYKMDVMFTQIISLLTRIHRATLRNWHHISLLVGNFAFVEETGLDDMLFSESDTAGRMP